MVGFVATEIEGLVVVVLAGFDELDGLQAG